VIGFVLLVHWAGEPLRSIYEARVAMALLEYRQREGKWPESLAALGDMPLDPYSGNPFVYERTESGARVRAAKEVKGKDPWKVLEEEDDLAWTFER